MVKYRCVQCQAETFHAAPAFCGCGSTTFTAIHLAMPADVDEQASSVDAGPEAGSVDDTAGQSVDVDDVGGFRCLQDGCRRAATHSFFWPSADEPSTRYACEEHAKKAEQLAPALGFSADVRPL